MIVLLDSENADRNLTSAITVLTHTPSATEPIQAQAIVYLGDGTKNLDGAGGDFEVTITVGGQTVEPNPQVITCSTAVRVALASAPFTVPPNAEVVIQVESPNAADTDVDVTAYLYDTVPVDSTLVDAAISSRAPSATALTDATWTDARAALLDRLDAAITSRAATGEAAAAVGTLNDISVADILGGTVEGTYTLEQMLRIAVAALAGELSGGGTNTVTFQGIDGATNRIVATITVDGNRTNVVLDGS